MNTKAFVMRGVLFCFICLCSFFVSFAQQTDNYEQAMRRAINNNNLNVALSIYNSAVEEDYYNLSALTNMACEIHYKQNNTDLAINLCKTLYDDDESNNLTDIMYICLLAKQGSNNDELISNIVQKIGDGYFDKNILSDLKILQKKDIDKATLAINRCIINDSIKDKDELFAYKNLLTLLYFSNEQYVAAYNSSADISASDNQGVMYYVLGVLSEKRREYASADVYLYMAIKNGYTHHDAYMHRAIAKGWEKDYVESNKLLDTCLMIDTNYYVYFLRGVNFLRMFRYEEALQMLDYSIQLNGTFADAYNYRGIVYGNMALYDFAVMDFKHAISLDNATHYAHNNLGMAYESLGKEKEAVEEYKKSISIEPHFAGGYYNLGRYYTNKRQISKAIKNLERAAELDEDISDSFYLLGVNYQRKNKKDTACEYYTQALEKKHTKAQDKIDNYCNKDQDTETDNENQNDDNNVENGDNEQYSPGQYDYDSNYEQ